MGSLVWRETYIKETRECHEVVIIWNINYV